MNLTDLLDALHVPYRRHGESPHVSEGWVGIPCHLCEGGSPHFKLGINLATLKATCWACGPVSGADAVASLSGEPRGLIVGKMKELDRIAPRRKGRGKLIMPSGLQTLGAAHDDYLANRGFDPTTMERIWKVQATGQVSDLPWHVVLPVYDGNDVVAWTARKIRDTGRRYFTPPDERCIVPLKHTLYGEHLAGASVCVVEGPLDVWAFGPGAVCTYGVGYTMAQLLRLTRFGKRVICFDSDSAGQGRAAKLCAALKAYDGETVNVVLDAKDLGEASPRERKLLRRMVQ